MTKIHLNQDASYWTWCGLDAWKNVLRTDDPKEATCQNCLKIRTAWLKRRETREGK